MSLSQYLSRCDQPLRELLEAVADSCAAISGLVRDGAMAGVLGALETENVQGETQKKMDVIADDLLLERCAKVSSLAAMASEELDTVQTVGPLDGTRRYLLLFDPLDGSSNIDVNVSIGTIFSVLPAPEVGAPREPVEEDFFQPGRNQVAAGYAIYGPQTSLVLTLGEGVAMFSLDSASGDWVQISDSVSVPIETKEYAINSSNARHWAEPVRRYVEECLAGETGPRGKNFNMRWVASMVADVHRIMMRGGVFLYPWDAREPGKPGKLRLLYEANPMSMLIEAAGGAAIDGRGPILDILPTGLHQRVSVMLGSASEVERLGVLHGGS